MRRGFTIIELLIVFAVFSIVLVFVVDMYTRSARADLSITAKMDMLQVGQMAKVVLTREVKQATEILVPPLGINTTRPYLIFTNGLNQLVVIYVTPDNQLVEEIRSNSSTRVLARGVTQFRAFRKDYRLVNIHVRLANSQTGDKLSFLTGIHVRNSAN